MHKSGGQTFDATTDSLEAIRDNQAGADATAIADAVWDEAKGDHTGEGSFGQEVQSHATAAEVATAVFGYTVEGALQFIHAIRIWLAALAGKSTGGGTTSVAFRDNADGKDRIAATVDTDGNRTEVTLDGS